MDNTRDEGSALPPAAPLLDPSDADKNLDLPARHIDWHQARGERPSE